MMCSRAIRFLLGVFIAAAICLPGAAQKDELFSEEAQLQRVLSIEAAIARAQARHGVISDAAAAEISQKATLDHVSKETVKAETDRVQHRMIGLLNVWKRAMSEEAANSVHLGVTTVDVYDTAQIIEMREVSSRLLSDLLVLEDKLSCLALEHQETPMVGRTLGQHAMPMTFGKKLAVWAGQNRRNIERLEETHARLSRSAILKGAVGTHLGLGPNADKIEQAFAEELGFEAPYPADWHGSRDVVAEYGQTLALIAKSNAAMGAEVFRLQMTDIAEVTEARRANTRSSSTMPHKTNPRLSEALIHSGRVIPRLAEVLLDDLENAFERDNTSRTNRVVSELGQAALEMSRDSVRLIDLLQVDEARMRQNLDTTGGLIMSQTIVLYLAPIMGREHAEEKIVAAARKARERGMSFKTALLLDPEIAKAVGADIEQLLDPTAHLGLAAQQVDATVAEIRAARPSDGPLTCTIQ